MVNGFFLLIDSRNVILGRGSGSVMPSMPGYTFVPYSGEFPDDFNQHYADAKYMLINDEIVENPEYAAATAEGKVYNPYTGEFVYPDEIEIPGEN